MVTSAQSEDLAKVAVERGVRRLGWRKQRLHSLWRILHAAFEADVARQSQVVGN